MYSLGGPTVNMEAGSLSIGSLHLKPHILPIIPLSICKHPYPDLLPSHSAGRLSTTELAMGSLGAEFSFWSKLGFEGGGSGLG